MKSTKKFTLKQLASYGGITAVLGGAAAGIAVGIENNQEKTLMLQGTSNHDKWSEAFYDDDVIAGKTKFYPAFELDGDGNIKKDPIEPYKSLAMSPSFRVSTTAHKDVAHTGLYVTNGFRIETGDLNEYDYTNKDGSIYLDKDNKPVHFDHNFTKLFGYTNGNIDFITDMNKLLAEQTSSITLDKGFKTRVDTSDAPFYANMENSSGLGVSIGTVSENMMVSVAFEFKKVLLDFIDNYSSTTKNESINKLANKISTSLPKGFAEENDLHSWLLQRKDQLISWTNTEITLPGTKSPIKFKDYLKKAVLYQTVYQIVFKSYQNILSNNIDSIRKFEGDNIPDALKNIYSGLSTVNGKRLGSVNHAGYEGEASGIEAISNLLKLENAGQGRTTGNPEDDVYDILNPDTSNNVIGSANSSKKWVYDETAGHFVWKDDEYTSIVSTPSENRFWYKWRNQYDRTFVKQNSLTLTPQIKQVDEDTINKDPSSDQKKAIAAIIKAVKEAAQLKKDHESFLKTNDTQIKTAKKALDDANKALGTNKEDKALLAAVETAQASYDKAIDLDRVTAATKLISSVFDGPIESRLSNDDILKIQYDEKTGKITGDFNVSSKVYFQTLFNNLHDGVTDSDKNVEILTKSLSKAFTPLLWNNSASQSQTDLEYVDNIQSNEDAEVAYKKAKEESDTADKNLSANKTDKELIAKAKTAKDALKAAQAKLESAEKKEAGDSSLLKDINGQIIEGSDITISFLNKESIKEMSEKAINYMYTSGLSGGLKPGLFGGAKIYQQAEKILIKKLEESQSSEVDVENMLTHKSSFDKGSYFHVDPNTGDIPEEDGHLQMNAATMVNFWDNIANDYGDTAIPRLLSIATFKLDTPGDYNFVPSYLQDLNNYTVAGKKIIDPSTGGFYESFQNDTFDLLNFLAKENYEVISGVTDTVSASSSKVAGYQMMGFVPRGTKIKTIKIGDDLELKAHMVPNVGAILSTPGVASPTRKFEKDLWISDVFNAGNYQDSKLLAPKSEGINEHDYKLQIIDEKDKVFVPTKTKFIPLWSATTGFSAVASMPYVVTTKQSTAGLEELYVAVFDNRKGV